LIQQIIAEEIRKGFHHQLTKPFIKNRFIMLPRLNSRASRRSLRSCLQSSTSDICHVYHNTFLLKTDDGQLSRRRCLSLFFLAMQKFAADTPDRSGSTGWYEATTQQSTNTKGIS